MLSYTFDNTAADAGGAILFIVFAVLYLALIAFGFYMYWRLVAKAGWPGWYSLALLIPLANVVFMVMFVFKEWPIEAENRMLRQQLAYGSGGFGAPPADSSRFGYPAAQPGYPAQPGYLTQPGYPSQSGYPTQSGYPEQGGRLDGPTA